MELETNPKAHQPEALHPATPVVRTEHAEGWVTRLVEHQSTKVSSHIFLLVSLVTMTVSLTLELAGRRRASRFIGMWPGPLLTMGVYNKLVKSLGAR
jgi:hypothetical protein